MRSNLIDRHSDTRQHAVSNKKLALILGLIAASIYGGYILAYYF